MDYEELKKQGIESFLADEELNKADKIERFVELNELFGPQGDKLLTGGM
ncbi:hypothetical protein KY888_004610, partial [Vibrio vulnificus]|nr:hypothetical protein [Vibrio vulnificus]